MSVVHVVLCVDAKVTSVALCHTLPCASTLESESKSGLAFKLVLVTLYLRTHAHLHGKKLAEVKPTTVPLVARYRILNRYFRYPA